MEDSPFIRKHLDLSTMSRVLFREHEKLLLVLSGKILKGLKVFFKSLIGKQAEGTIFIQVMEMSLHIWDPPIKPIYSTQ